MPLVRAEISEISEKTDGPRRRGEEAVPPFVLRFAVAPW